MLTHHRKTVCLSFVSTDLPVWSVVETAATLYQKDCDRFHLLLTTPPVNNCKTKSFHNEQKDLSPELSNGVPDSPRVLWLEISPYRVIMTMQGNNQLSYRHFWEQGVYGITRYWLPGEPVQQKQPIRLRNFTRNLKLDGHPFPTHLQVEYELWTGEVQLGKYVLQLDIKH